MISQAFRVSLFVHDILTHSMVDESTCETYQSETLHSGPTFEHKRNNIFIDEVYSEVSNSPFLTSKCNFHNSDVQHQYHLSEVWIVR